MSRQMNLSKFPRFSVEQRIKWRKALIATVQALSSVEEVTKSLAQQGFRKPDGSSINEEFVKNQITLVNSTRTRKIGVRRYKKFANKRQKASLASNVVVESDSSAGGVERLSKIKAIIDDHTINEQKKLAIIAIYSS